MATSTVEHRQSPPAGLQESAAELLDAMALVRRTARRTARRPSVLSRLTGSQLELVRLVARLPGVTVAEAADELRLAPNTVSTLVGQLTAAGLVVRLADQSDRRVARLELEPGTRQKVSAWRDRRVEAVAAAMARLSARDRDRLAGISAVLVEVADALGQLGEEQ